MKNTIIILASIIFSMSFTQEKKNSEDIYFYIKSSKFYGFKGEYKTYFTMMSDDERFSHDNYYFRIFDNEYSERKLYNLGERVHLDSINYVLPENYFEGKSNCDIHSELSSMNTSKSKRRVFIITEIHPERLIRETDKSKKHMIWYATYDGTKKDIVHTNLGKNIFLRN